MLDEPVPVEPLVEPEPDPDRLAVAPLPLLPLVLPVAVLPVPLVPLPDEPSVDPVLPVPELLLVCVDWLRTWLVALSQHLPWLAPVALGELLELVLWAEAVPRPATSTAAAIRPILVIWFPFSKTAMVSPFGEQEPPISVQNKTSV